MTREDKHLLLITLCGMLPYGVWGLHRGEDLPLYVIDNSGAYMVLGYNAWFNLETVPFKPYLRPMSSMTMEEQREYISVGRGMSPDNPSALVDWFNEKKFDYRGLIPMDLALEAKEGMYV